METNKKVEEQVEYGVNEPVPQSARHFGFWDMILTWMGGNFQPGSWTIGGTLAAVGFAGAFTIVLVANPIAYAILALIGFISYKIGIPTMSLTRASIGVRGSKVAIVCNLINMCGWTAVSNFLAAITMSYVFNMALGTPAYGSPGSAPYMIIGCCINGILSFLAIYIGGSRSLKIFERIMMIVLLILTTVITVLLTKSVTWAQLWSWVPPVENRVSFGTGFDAMLAFSITWCTLVGDYTRYTKNVKSATAAPIIGAVVAVVWFAIIGVIGVATIALQTGVFDGNNANPSSMIMALGLGWIALIVVVFSTVTTNMIDLYSSSVNLMNLDTKMKPKTAICIVGAFTILVSWVPVFMGSFLNAFFSFMNILAAVFPPMIAIIIVDFYFIRNRQYDVTELDKKEGKYWYKDGVNWVAVGTWLLGSATYLMLSKAGFGANSVGSVLPTILLCGIVYYIASKVAISKKYYKDLL